MKLSLGIVGLPNVGKSTLFRALTRQNVEIANYPFATIDPNIGIVTVPDDRLEKLAAMSRSKKIIPTAIEFYDIAGLVKGANSGEGLGNKFLSHIRETDAIVQVVRVFEDKNIIHVENEPDPVRDLQTIELELMLADLASAEKALGNLEKNIRAGQKEAAAASVVLQKIISALRQGTPVRLLELGSDETALIKSLSFLTQKPLMILLNADDTLLKNKSKLQDVKNDLAAIAHINADYIIAAELKLESELADLPEPEAREMRKEIYGNSLAEQGIDALITAGYKLLNLITFLTTGEDETRAWTIHRGDLAPQAAGRIHTDFEKGFIRADVIAWDKLLEAGSWSAARAHGWLRSEGKEYVVKDGDVIEFKFSN